MKIPEEHIKFCMATFSQYVSGNQSPIISSPEIIIENKRKKGEKEKKIKEEKKKKKKPIGESLNDHIEKNRLQQAFIKLI